MIRLCCNRCGRPLKREGKGGLGPKCYAATQPAKPRRVRIFDRTPKRDTTTVDMFGLPA